MKLCDYGCRQEAKFQLKNEKWCCSKHWSSCKKSKENNSIANKNLCKSGRKRKSFFTETICRFCSKKSDNGHITRHERYCYLNPYNIKLCPVCDNPIKHFNINTTCSVKCARKYFEEMYTEGCRKGKNLTYRTICFDNHKKKCVVCGEENLVTVHHYDENHKNDLPENLIPICPTHQFYMHSKFKDLIIEKVELYRKEWLEKYGASGPTG